MAHTGGLFFVSVPLAVARGSRTEVGASKAIEKEGGTECSRTERIVNSDITVRRLLTSYHFRVPSRCYSGSS